jgi:predicted transcriptional regulator
MTALRNLMSTKLVVIRSGKTLGEAAEIIAEHRIRHLPVVNADARIIGIVSITNVADLQRNRHLPVDLFMSPAIFHVSEDVPMKQAIFKMLENKVSYLLVTDPSERVVGIVTTDDLLWYLASQIENLPAQNQHGLGTLLNRQTVGQIAHQLSEAGI